MTWAGESVVRSFVGTGDGRRRGALIPDRTEPTVYGDLSIHLSRALTDERLANSPRHSAAQPSPERAERPKRTAAPARGRIRTNLARVR
jgi:hypothetical protein